MSESVKLTLARTFSENPSDAADLFCFLRVFLVNPSVHCFDSATPLSERPPWIGSPVPSAENMSSTLVCRPSRNCCRIVRSFTTTFLFGSSTVTDISSVISAEWQYRHAGLMALSTIGEGTKATMEPHLEQIIDSMLPFLRDPVCSTNLKQPIWTSCCGMQTFAYPLATPGGRQEWLRGRQGFPEVHGLSIPHLFTFAVQIFVLTCHPIFQKNAILWGAPQTPE